MTDWGLYLTGAFLAGIIVPRDGGLAIALTEKLEDIASIVFLPLVSLSSHVSCRTLLRLKIDVIQSYQTLILFSISHSPVCLPIWVFSTMASLGGTLLLFVLLHISESLVVAQQPLDYRDSHGAKQAQSVA